MEQNYLNTLVQLCKKRKKNISIAYLQYWSKLSISVIQKAVEIMLANDCIVQKNEDEYVLNPNWNKSIESYETIIDHLGKSSILLYLKIGDKLPFNFNTNNLNMSVVIFKSLLIDFIENKILNFDEKTGLVENLLSDKKHKMFYDAIKKRSLSEFPKEYNNIVKFGLDKNMDELTIDDKRRILEERKEQILRRMRELSQESAFEVLVVNVAKFKMLYARYIGGIKNQIYDETKLSKIKKGIDDVFSDIVSNSEKYYEDDDKAKALVLLIQHFYKKTKKDYGFGFIDEYYYSTNNSKYKSSLDEKVIKMTIELFANDDYGDARINPRGKDMIIIKDNTISDNGYLSKIITNGQCINMEKINKYANDLGIKKVDRHNGYEYIKTIGDGRVVDIFKFIYFVMILNESRTKNK